MPCRFRRRQMPRARLRASGPLGQLPSSLSDRHARGFTSAAATCQPSEFEKARGSLPAASRLTGENGLPAGAKGTGIRTLGPLQDRRPMTVRGFTEETHSNYIREVRAFAAFIRRPPDTATAEDLRRFQLHQTQSGMQPPSINSSVSALRFFFAVTLDRPDLARRLTVVRQPRRLPAVLSVEEITLLLQAAPGPKYKAAFATAYGAGLRVSEVVALKVGDIDSERMLLRVEQGKGRKD